MFNIVMYEPEIPQNTGNIVRTAAAIGGHVHLIKPLGFDISDKALKRAGLDYWHLTDFSVYENIQDFFNKNAPGRFHLEENGSWVLDNNTEDARGPHFYFCSTKAQLRYDEVKYSEGDYLFFGPETRGLPEILLHENYNMTVRIPMVKDARSLNLSNSVAIVVYEGMRQSNFKYLQDYGKLTKY